MRTLTENLSAISKQVFIIEATNDQAQISVSTENIHTFVTEIETQLGLEAQHHQLMKLTGMLDEHPEGWDGECACKECMSRE